MAAPLALVCGAGAFPLAVADAAAADGRSLFLIGIRGAADPAIAKYPHAWAGMGRVSRMFRLFRESGAREVAFVGAVPRPSFSLDFVPDLRFIRTMISVLGAGDDGMLRVLTRELEREGLVLRGVHEVAPGLILPAGPLGRHQPSAEAVRAAKLGFDVLDALGPFDIGQGAVVADKRVVAIEAAEGTDRMLMRASEMRAAGLIKVPSSRCVFVKAARRGQDLRLDTPAIGVETVARAKAAGLSGIAVAAGQVMTPDLAALIVAADRGGLFILGMDTAR